jgi:heme/copper-type cytochrome/quinol oxidase subunit 2
MNKNKVDNNSSNADESEGKVSDNGKKEITDSFFKRLGEKLQDVDIFVSNYRGWINILELILWVVILGKIFSPDVNEYHEFKYGFSLEYMWWKIPAIVKIAFFWLLPLAFTMVYQVSPIFIAVLRAFSIRLSPTISEYVANQRAEVKALEKPTKNDLADKYLQSLVYTSSSLSRDIYSRGNVYILFGVIFSIVGVAFFYSQVHAVKFDGNLITTLLTLAPNFGVLLFIEFISFFFLKQYRATMDDFRYYEAIKRSREETLAVIKLLAIKENDIDYLSILDKLKFSSDVGKLNNGQTTELLEARKYNKNEMELFGKIIEALTKKN